MNIKLESLVITNWKGITSFVFSPDGLNADVLGPNRKGKTTLFDSYLWLLFDRDSLAAATQSIAIKKIHPDDMEPVHNLDHTVEGVFNADGDKTALKKIYREKWTQRRGSSRQDFTGHETKHWIDGEPVTQGEYKKRLEALINADIFQLVSDPLYFAGLDWTKQRDIFLKIFQDEPLADIVAADPSLDSVMEILGKSGTDGKKKALKDTIKEINKQLKEIPARIDELNRQKKPVVLMDGLKDDLARVRLKISDNEKELADLKAGDGAAFIESQIRATERKIREIENEYMADRISSLKELKTQIGCEKSTLLSLRKSVETAHARFSDANKELMQIEAETAQLVAEWKRVFSSQPDFSGIADTCPACGQSLPEDQIEKATEKTRSKFETDKHSDLQFIESKGQTIKKRKESIQSGLESAKGEYSKTLTRIENTESLIIDLTKKEDGLQSEIEAGAPPELTAFTRSELDALKKDLEKSGSGKPNLEPITKIIAALKAEEESILHSISEQKNNVDVDARIKELMGSEKELAARYEQAEHDLDLINRLIIARAEALSGKVDKHFSCTRFKFFENQINEGVNETFVICNDEGVPWKSMNSASRRLCGIDIINVLSKHYNLYVPVWIDNAESITDWYVEPDGSQFFRLFASNEVKELTVETR